MSQDNIEQTATELKDQIIELPTTLLKISKKIVLLNERILNNKKEANEMYNEMKELEKLLERYMAGCVKKIRKDNEPKPRKPSGFAAPTQVSDKLCDFMGRPHGDLISRTETSSFLSQYISKNGLISPEHKNIILPDEKLQDLLGEEARDQTITYFTIQKYMNKHFYKRVPFPSSTTIQT